MGYEGGWLHGCRCLVAVSLFGCSNEKGSRLFLMNSILVSRFSRSQQGLPYD